MEINKNMWTNIKKNAKRFRRVCHHRKGLVLFYCLYPLLALYIYQTLKKICSRIFRHILFTPIHSLIKFKQTAPIRYGPPVNIRILTSVDWISSCQQSGSCWSTKR